VKFNFNPFGAMERRIMGRLDSVNDALDNIGTQLEQLVSQIAALSAGSVSQEEIDALAAKAQGIADAVDAAIEEPGEDEAAAPAPEPEPVP
jgi:hypothetical protein